VKKDAIWAKGRTIAALMVPRHCPAGGEVERWEVKVSCWKVRGCRWGNKLNIRAEFCILRAAARLIFDNIGMILFGWKF